jgi:hypothetical protein
MYDCFDLGPTTIGNTRQSCVLLVSRVLKQPLLPCLTVVGRAKSGRFRVEWGLCWADSGTDSGVSKRRLGPTQGRLGPTGDDSRGRLHSAHAGPTRSAEWWQGRPTHSPRSDPHLWRVALAGSDSPLRAAISCAAPSYFHQKLVCVLLVKVAAFGGWFTCFRPLSCNSTEV